MLARRRRETAESLCSQHNRGWSLRGLNVTEIRLPAFDLGLQGSFQTLMLLSVCCFTKTLGMFPWLSDAGELERGETLPSGILSYCLCKQLRLTQIAETVGMEVLE